MRTISALLLSSIALVAAGAASAAFAAVDTTPPTPVAPPAATANVLAFSPVTLDMGAMTAGQPKTLDLTITNTSGSPVTIESIKGGCGCTKVTDPPDNPAGDHRGAGEGWQTTDWPPNRGLQRDHSRGVGAWPRRVR